MSPIKRAKRTDGSGSRPGVKAFGAPLARARSRGATAADPASIVGALRELDVLLSVAIAKQAARLGPESLLDPFRGMHLSRDDVAAALAEQGHVPLGDSEPFVARIVQAALRVPDLARHAASLGLEPIDIAIVVIALAPDVELRYERLYAYLQDDIARKRPTPDLVANILCASTDERIALYGRFDSAAPLAAHGLIRSGANEEMPWLARPLGVGAPWRNLLLGRRTIDAEMAPIARIVDAAGHGLDGAFVDRPVRDALRCWIERGASEVRVVLTGPHGAGKAALAGALAREIDRQLLLVDVRDLPTAADVSATIRRARCTALLLDCLLFIHGAGKLAQRDPQLSRALVEALGPSETPFVLALDAPLPPLHAAPLHALHLDLGFPGPEARLRAWVANVSGEGIACEVGDIEPIAARFTLSVAQIAQAAAHVGAQCRLDGTERATGRELAAAARSVCGDELERLARRISPVATFDTLVVVPEVEAQLREICQRLATSDRVRREWACGSVHARNAGVTALFAGPSGTGKTLAAEAIAGELGLDLFCIDLSAVVSKYIGETEKNLDRVFAAAERANAVLFFDEADALFGKRSEVKDAHDRYANIEIAYLLQKMEQFDGLAILATNLKQNLDEAFARRLTFSLNFAFPEVSERRRLWDSLWPPNAPRGDDVDFDWFAQQYPMSGGNIRNAVLAAAHLAAANGQVIDREHLLHGMRREYQKLGKNLAIPASLPGRPA